ncbi:MAG: hypothetical protein ACN4GT_11840 [Gammaproteobacteria bacterium]
MDDAGALLLEDGGTLHTVVSGEVTLRGVNREARS